MTGRHLCFSLLALSFVFLLLPIASAQVTINGRGCSGNRICDTVTTCDPAAGTCSTTTQNCATCAASAVTCSNGIPRTAFGICQEDGLGGATCLSDPNACTSSTSSGRSVYTVQFEVFTIKNISIIIDPNLQTTIAGRTLNYLATVSNNHPLDLTLYTDVRILGKIGPSGNVIPVSGWNASSQPTLTVEANNNAQFSFDVTSPVDAELGEYLIAVSVVNPNLQIFGTTTAKYAIDIRSAPLLQITPSSALALPGQPVVYTVDVTNGDPAGFGDTTIFLSPKVPTGWIGVLSRPSIRIAAGETGTLNFTVASPNNATVGSFVAVNATANDLSSARFVLYNVTLCGDGICQLNEVCALDCGQETLFSCPNGRCEEETDDGVKFDARVSFLFTRFLVCKKSATIQQCEADYDKSQTGITKNAICGSNTQTGCSVKCVDSSGAYYLYARGIGTANRTTYNYAYTCPEVNLSVIKGLRDDFSFLRDAYDKEKSIVTERINTGDTTEKSRFQPCLDTLVDVVAQLNTHITYMNAVIASPAKSNTTNARGRSEQLLNDVGTRVNQFCRGTETGFLKLETVQGPGLTEIDKDASSTVTMTNIGSREYYGYSQCDFILGTTKVTQNNTCARVGPGESRTFTPRANVKALGDWTFQCRTYGTLSSNCTSPTQHDVVTKTFSVFTKEIFVESVSGTCDLLGITCTVKASQPQSCVRCRLGGTNCEKLSQNGTTTIFSCGAFAVGTKNLTATVYDTDVCDPIEPAEKTTSVLCEGCGDGQIQRNKNETCELPNTDNNPNVPQTSGPQCASDGTKRSTVRDSYGYCSASCTGIIDAPKFTCRAAACGAECSDSETRDLRVNATDGYCYVTQQCGGDCSFNNADCETANAAPFVDDFTVGTGVELTTSMSPANPDTLDRVTIKAESATEGITQIFVDGIERRYCTSSPCVFTSIYNASVHSYYALLTYGNDTLRNPTTGAHIFAVVQSGPTNCTTTITSKTCSFSFDTNRYYVNATAVKSGIVNGTHSYLVIENDEGKAFVLDSFSRYVEVGPGLKTIISVVQSANHANLCVDQETILCGGTETIGDEPVSIARDIDSVVKLETTDMKVTVSSDMDLPVFRFTEYVPANLLAAQFKTSKQGIQSGPTLVTRDGVDYNAYSWTVPMSEGETFVVEYRVRFESQGDYEFASLAQYGGPTKSEEKTVFATNCAQTSRVSAKDEKGDCRPFRTACDVPFNWKQVQTCAAPSPPVLEPDPTEVDLLTIIPIVGIMAAFGIFIKFRGRLGIKGGKEEKIIKKLREAT